MTNPLQIMMPHCEQTWVARFPYHDALWELVRGQGGMGEGSELEYRYAYMYKYYVCAVV